MIDNKKHSVLLDDLLDAITSYQRHDNGGDIEISAVTSDSRQVNSGSLFVAVRGTAVDGHKFIPAALAAGAAAIVAEELPNDVLATFPDGVAAIVVPDSHEALGRLASRFFGDPSEELVLVGVTGTNGKTTVATLLYEAARLRGLKAGLISTVANIIDGEATPAEHTTPDPVLLNSLLRRMADAGCSFVAMEVSSHAADQKRIAGLNYAGGVFTNLTRDHLDYHKTVDAYLRAKKSFFDGLPSTAFALVNADDRNGAVMIQNTQAACHSYSVRDVADYTLKVVEDRLDGMLLEIGGRQVETLFTGRFNASNLAAVYGALRLLGVDTEEALVLLSRLRPVAGRFQTFCSKTGVYAIVDFAHTPDALENVLETINEVASDEAAIITVCGAGGDRDRGKRPLMARSAAERSHILVLTSDNPRSEDPMAIIDEMLAGLDDDQRARTIVEPDRRIAIEKAVAAAKPGDVVLVAGKGHETTQTIGKDTFHFDDREEVCRALDLPYNA